MSLRFVPGEALELGLEEALGLLRGEGVAHNQLVRALPLLLLPVPHHYPPPPLNRRNSAAAVLDFSDENPISPRWGGWKPADRRGGRVVGGGHICRERLWAVIEWGFLFGLIFEIAIRDVIVPPRRKIGRLWQQIWGLFIWLYYPWPFGTEI